MGAHTSALAPAVHVVAVGGAEATAGRPPSLGDHPAVVAGTGRTLGRAPGQLPEEGSQATGGLRGKAVRATEQAG